MENFDKNLEKLQEVVNKLDNEITLEEAVKLFTEGVELSKKCKDYLNKTNENLLKVEK